MEKPLRTFIAFEFRAQDKKSLFQIQQDFQKLNLPIKWVTKENIHLTLKFLGNTLPSQVKTITQTLDTVISKYSAQTFPLTTLGAFPSVKRPKIFFVSFKDKKVIIPTLADQIEKVLIPIGFPKETRTFKSHITLGRLKTLKNSEAFKNKMEKYSFPHPISITFEKITFFKSTLTSQGPIYQSIKSYPLKQENNT